MREKNTYRNVSLSIKAIICLCIVAITLSGAAIIFSYFTFESILIDNYASSIDIFSDVLMTQIERNDIESIHHLCEGMRANEEVKDVCIYNLSSNEIIVYCGDSQEQCKTLLTELGDNEQTVTKGKTLIINQRYTQSKEGVGILVQMPMKMIRDKLVHFAIMLITVIMEVTVLLVVVSWKLVKKCVVSPIMTMSEATRSFLLLSSEDTEIEGKLMNIKILTGDEIQILWESIVQMENRIKSYIEHITEMTIHAERIQTELSVASKIQASMLPAPIKEGNVKKKINLYAMMQPAKEVAGDFYDYFMIDERHLGVVVADISGKSIPAALFMVVTKAVLKNNLIYYKNISKAVEDANHQLCEENKENMFATAFIGIIDIESGDMHYCNAGHTKTLLIEENGNLVWLKDRQGIILGAFADSKYKEGYLHLKKKNYLYIYTDGVTEACSVEGNFFGEKRLAESIKESFDNHWSLEKSIITLEEELRLFAGGDNQADDITILGVELL